MAEKRKDTRGVTPVVTLGKYARVGKPNTNFDADGSFEVTAILTAEQVSEIEAAWAKDIAIAEQLLADAKKGANKADRKRWVYETPWKEQDDGTFHLRVKRKAGGVDKDTGERWSVRIPVFDSAKNPIDPRSITIGAGTQARIAYSLRPFAMPANKITGISVRLQALQIVELVEFERGADDYGFEDIEDGFTVGGDEDEGEVALAGGDGDEADF